MSVFDDFIKIDENNNFNYIGWVEWNHVMTGFIHCQTCLSLDKCWFNKLNMPRMPQHKNCHCKVKTILEPLQGKISAECKIQKFSNYVFSSKYESNGKIKLFRIMGYGIQDSEYLKNEFEKQAKIEYSKSNYILRNLDKYGQRVNIPIVLENNNKKYTILSGWVVRPNGKLELATPLADY